MILRTSKLDAFNNCLALYFYTLGIKRRSLSVLHGFGLVSTYQTVIQHSAKITDHAAETIKRVGRESRNRVVIVWDSFDYEETVHYETLRKTSEHISCTTGLLIVSDHIPNEGIRLNELNVKYPLDPLNIFHTPGNQNNDIQRQSRLFFFFEALRSTHPEVIDTIFESHPQKRPQFPHIKCLEPKVTTRYEMGPIMEDEGSISGTFAVMNHILLDTLAYDIEDPHFGEIIQLSYGDQKIVSLVHSVKRIRKYSKHAYEKFEAFLPIPGLFHFKMNFMDLIYSHFSSDSDALKSPCSLKHNEHHIGIAKGHKLPFHHKEQVVMRCFDARVVAMAYDFIKTTSKVDITDFDAIEDHLESFNADTILLMLNRMVDQTFINESLLAFDKKDESVDQAHRVLCQFLDVMMTYKELKHAVKYDDIGFIKSWLLNTQATSDPLKHAILANGLVNTSGKKDSFYEIDRLNEFTNYKLKYTSVIKSDVVKLCGEKTNLRHQAKDVRDDIYQLAHMLHSQKLTRRLDTGRFVDLQIHNLVDNRADNLYDRVEKFSAQYITKEDQDDHEVEFIKIEDEDNPDVSAPLQLRDFSEVINVNEYASLAEFAHAA
ncbi:hypothetical protein KEM56_002005 [Ascosphaera pollenicola]|nr:hypothetical protein KEM56_002005 [Ascosphaera pollenicola]